MGVRPGLSHFLEIVIMVGLIGVLGMLLYSGALDLFAGWGNVQQLTINSVYKIGDNVNVTVTNMGNTIVSIDSVKIYDLNGNLLGSSTGGLIEPGRSMEYSFTNTTVSEGELIDVLVVTTDGKTFKFRVAVQ